MTKEVAEEDNEVLDAMVATQLLAPVESALYYLLSATNQMSSVDENLC